MNCAHCHRGLYGGGDSPFDLVLDFDNGDRSASYCDVPPLRGDLGVPGAKIVDPGSPDTSVLYLRMATRGAGKMPPLDSSLVDQRALTLVREWVTDLACP